jgi:Ca2+:H+ antiporter
VRAWNYFHDAFIPHVNRSANGTPIARCSTTRRDRTARYVLSWPLRHFGRSGSHCDRSFPDEASMFGVSRIWLVAIALAAVAAAFDRFQFSSVAVFLAAGVAVAPLAAVMGRATEALAGRLGPKLGGLLNATFGNAAELILAFIAMRRGLTTLVKASLTGSIIGNSLLVLGMSFVVGGLRHRKQSFDRSSAGIQATLLVLAAIGLVVPSTLYHLIGAEAEVELSVEVSIVLAGAYVLSLVYAFAGRGGSATIPATPANGRPAASPWVASGSLLAAAGLIAYMSELLTSAVEQGGLRSWGMTDLFIGTILVAVIGNAAEHSTAVLMAWRNKPDVVLEITVGSSLQIALLVTPLLVFAGSLTGSHPLDLHFTPMEILAVVASVLIVALVAADGESNWMEGVLLLAVYLILALAFYHIPVPRGGGG